MTDLDLDALEALCGAATEGPWELRIAPREGESKAEYVTGALADNDDPLWLAITPPTDDKVTHEIPFLTGDGPTSRANAEFIAAARDAVPALIAEVRRLSVPATEGQE